MLQAEEEFREQREEHRQQLEEARRENAGALLQAARLQSALSKAEEALAARTALSTRLAQAASAAQQAGAQQAADWSAERAQLLLNSQQLAEQLKEVQERAHEAQLAQVCPVLSMLLRAAVQDLPLPHMSVCQPRKPFCKPQGCC